MEQEKRGLCPYDDKRYLLADLADGRPNPNTHAYGHYDLAAEEHLVADQPEPGAELIIRHPEERFARKHARVKGASNSLAQWTWRRCCQMKTPTASFMATSFWWPSKWQPCDRVAPSEWVTSSNGL